MRMKYYILIGLVGLVIALTLVTCYFLRPEKIPILESSQEEISEEAPGEEVSEEGSVEEEVTQESEIRAAINEIKSMVNDFTDLVDSINELDEDEDLLKIFQGD